ncbi:hypothetical protein [Photobacterium sp. GB-1]|uniref:hypothetical protein n=1 Tax=Photobacterium sp. GB-1 TaxID=2022111 RepID=UPI000D17D4A5|nr:hypothetical protein [Photobacterium sp. GB-1]PSV52016.1 hypothetical protein C9J45_12665 [Photobacterium sp. GB-1]
MSPHERDTTDDLDTLTKQLPALRQLLDQMCGNTNSHLFIATYHEPLQSLHLSRTHIAIKQPGWKTFMCGEELQTWQKWLDSVWLTQK